MTTFDRDKYFDAIRASLFHSMSQSQVDGQNDMISEWEANYADKDIRWLAYALATAYHETSQEMQPIAEYGKGSGMEYGKKDPETGQTYYGRGYVQLTWRDNYAKADAELQLDPKCEWDADQQLRANVAAPTMYIGMIEGWFRGDSKGRQTLARYFDSDTEDAYGAREIINGDKTKVPSWSNGVSIGNLIKGYFEKFRAALGSAAIEGPPPAPEPAPEPGEDLLVRIAIGVPPGVQVQIKVNDKEWKDVST